MKTSTAIAGGIVLGAAAMYFFDPRKGAYRRTFVRDKVRKYSKLVQKEAEVIASDLLHRSQGVLAEARTRMTAENVSEPILVARVSSKLGRVVANPHSLHLSAQGSKLFISGPIYSDEVEPLLRAVRAVPGVKSVETQFDTHLRNENYQGLQGHRRLRGEQIDLFQDRWSPATRFLVSLAGSVIAMSAGAAFSSKKKAA
jgi:gas vesicle protein